MNYLLKVILLLIALQFSHGSEAQTSVNGQKEARQLLSQAKEEMAAQDFQAANRSFRKMLDLKVALPTEMCYFFANTLFMLGQFENSLRFIEKYEKLAGTGGEYYLDSQKLKELLKKEGDKIRACSLCSNAGYILTKCNYCENKGQLVQSCMKCFGNKHTKCKTCDGEGVVIVKDHFGKNNYQTCETCNGHGFQECAYCGGQGVKIQDCSYCEGSGKVATSEICKHPHLEGTQDSSLNGIN